VILLKALIVAFLVPPLSHHDFVVRERTTVLLSELNKGVDLRRPLADFEGHEDPEVRRRLATIEREYRDVWRGVYPRWDNLPGIEKPEPDMFGWQVTPSEEEYRQQTIDLVDAMFRAGCTRQHILWMLTEGARKEGLK
jgi:hypothetical protein